MIKPIKNNWHRLLYCGLLAVYTADSFAIEISEDYLKALINETKALREETKQLRSEVGELKKQLANRKPKPIKKVDKPVHTAPVAGSAKKSASQVAEPKPEKKAPPFESIPLYINPSLGTPSLYDGSQLLTNIAQSNSDLSALQYRQAMSAAANDKGVYDNFYLVLSGSLNGQISTLQPYFDSAESDIDLPNANITAMAGIGKWITGFFSFDYDNAPPASLNPPQVGPRYLNSRVFLDQGFITIGNLQSSNFYGSIGQMYIPFGQYNGFAINSPLTSTLFTTIERPILLGFSHNTDTFEIDGSIYGYQGDVTLNNQSSVNEMGLALDYYLNQNQFNANLGIGYISNVADSEGMQLNGQYPSGCRVFGGFAYPCNNGNSLQHRVPGFDIHGSFTFGPYSIISEYITSTRHFAKDDLSFNRKGAKPMAFDIEAGYEFLFLQKPSTISFGYGYTRQALALLVPAKQYVATISTSLWRNTTQSLSFEHNINYGTNTEAGGQNLPVYFQIDRANLGKSSNSIIFAINASF